MQPVGDALLGFEPIIESPVRSQWTALVDAFEEMDCDRIGKTYGTKDEACKARAAIWSAIKRKGYAMSAHTLGCLVYVEKEKR